MAHSANSHPLDLDPKRFPFAKLQDVVGKSFTLESGYLRAKVEPPRNDLPEYLELNGADDDTGDNDSRWEEIMEMFEADSHDGGRKRFVMEYVVRNGSYD